MSSKQNAITSATSLTVDALDASTVTASVMRVSFDGIATPAISVGSLGYALQLL